MAKKPKDDFIDPSLEEAPETAVEVPEESPDDMRARIALLEEELARRPTVEQARAMSERIEDLEDLEYRLKRTVNPPPEPRGPGAGYWKVELQHAPARIVRAADPANAWDEYRRVLGVIGSEYSPEIGASTREEYEAQEELLARQRGEK